MAMTVTATQNHNELLLRVFVLTGYAPSQAGAGSATGTGLTCSVTTTQTGSRVYGAAITSNVGGTPNGSTTGVDNVTDTNGAQWLTFKAASLTGTPGATTLGYSSGGTPVGIAALEILSSGTLTEEASGPAAVSTQAAAAVTTAAFTPPSGALLVALVSGAGGSAGTITMTSSPSVSWIETVKQAANDYAGVWLAHAPAWINASGNGGTTF